MQDAIIIFYKLAVDNPYTWLCGTHNRPQKVNVWTFIIDKCIPGPYFIDGTNTAERYFHIYLFPKELNSDWTTIPTHFALTVSQYIDETFSS